MRWIAAILVALSLTAAAPAALADDASRLQLARQVVEVAHAGENMRAVMPVMVQQMRTLIGQQGAASEAQIGKFVQRFQDRFNQEIPSFVDLVAKVYAREFSDEDLSNLLAFYRTPTGQHLLGKQQEIAKGMLAVGQDWGKTVAQEVLAEMQKDQSKAPSPKL
ncbi:MAG: DUF2059 domain-containing protein [Janthinobacterium lividum]